MEIKRILGTDKGKDAFYKADDNFVAIQSEVGNEVLGTIAQTIKGAINENKNAIDVIEGQVAQATYASVTKQEPVFSLGADEIKGQVPMNAKGLSAVNLIKNGNFANGTAGWTGSYSTIAASNKVCTVTGIGTNNIPGVIVTPSNKYYAGHVYYSRFKARVTNSLCTLMKARFASGFGDININNPVANTLYTQSRVFTATSDVTSPDYVHHAYTDNTTANGKVMEVMEVMSIDLTVIDLALKTALECDYMFPKYFDGIGSVNDVKVKSRGKNLFDGMLELGGISSTTGQNTSDYTTYTRTINYINMKSNTQYVVKNYSASTSLTAIFYDLNKNYISFAYIVGNLLSFTTPSNCAFVRIRVQEVNIMSKNQLEEGTVATSYEPYVESISPLPDLKSVPNGVKDEVIEGKFAKKISDKLILNGNLNWISANTTTNTYVFAIVGWASENNVKQSIQNSGIGNSADGDTYLVSSSATVPDERGINFGSSNSNGYAYVRIDKSKIDATAGATLVDKLKTYLNQYPITLIYELAVPIVEDIVTPLTVFPKGTISIESDSETTIPELTLNYPINTAGAIEKLNDAVNQITKVIHEEAQWITATLQNGWTGILRYRKNQIGLIELAWELTPGTVTSGTVISQLPSDYFPIGITALLSIKNTDASTIRGLVFTADGKVVVRMSEIVAGVNYLGTAVLRGV